MANTHNRESLSRDITRLGVASGDILFIHSSFKSLGEVEGGAGTVVGALEDSVGPEGLILMPSFNLVEWEKRPLVWNLQTSPSTVGWLTEFFRQMPGTLRSDHYSHSVAARGNGAREFVAEHLRTEGLHSRWDREPWGRTFGTFSPMQKAFQNGGKILMLGVDYESSTYVHIAESRYRKSRLDGEEVGPHPFSHLTRVGEYWERVGELRTDKIGDAICRLFRIREYVDTVVSEFNRNMDDYLKGYL